jgi:glycosyltransferase involved in cell wall biosynthesis
MPKVSTIIPVYNGSRFIIEAVESVLQQTYRDFETVVVDDGSTDNVKTLLRPYIDAGKIRYVYQRNSGPAKARNMVSSFPGGPV